VVGYCYRCLDVVVCLSVCLCVLITAVSPAKTAKLIEMLFRGELQGTKELCISLLDGTCWCYLVNMIERFLLGGNAGSLC